MSLRRRETHKIAPPSPMVDQVVGGVPDVIHWVLPTPPPSSDLTQFPLTNFHAILRASNASGLK